MIEQTGEMSYGFGANFRDVLPIASFVGFNAMLIEQIDANTRAVFGEYVSGYDILQAVIDKATVPIYYERRLAKLSLNEAELPKVDSEFEEITEITEGEEEDRKHKLKTKWAALEALVGSEKRITANRLTRHDAFRMIQRRAVAAGLSNKVCCHTFRATGITAYLENGGTVEDAQAIAAHESPRTTKLYDRTSDEITLDEIERIRI